MRRKRVKTCSDCIHEDACQGWNLGALHDTDASNCINYETVKDSAAYFIGYHEACKDFRSGDRKL